MQCPLAAMLTEIRFADLAGWAEDDHRDAFRAFRRSALAAKLPKTRSLGIDGSAFASAFAAAGRHGVELSAADARSFFETYFQPCRIDADGFVTGYYEPEVEASPTRDETFTVPLHARPPELVDIDDGNRPEDWDPAVRFAGCHGGKLLPFADRRAIDLGFLHGLGLELAWLADPVDAYFIHIQGSARLAMTDGTRRRISYAGKSGHEYTSIGKLAVERGYLALEAADKAGLEAWLKADPVAGRALMHENRSYIFFRLSDGLSDKDGPLGAAHVPLTPLRSLAVDRTMMTFHTPVWVAADELGFRRLMVAQDTGSAIVGPARGDIFFGSGDKAGLQAGPVRHRASMVALVPKSGPDQGQNS